VGLEKFVSGLPLASQLHSSARRRLRASTRLPLWLESKIQSLGAPKALNDVADNRSQEQRNIMLLLGSPETRSWIETGTYQGSTTRFLANRFPKVCTIEPSTELFFETKLKLRGYSNVTMLRGASEKRLLEAINMSTPPLSFWLDGHYSGGITFRGPMDCPLVSELEQIRQNVKAKDIHVVLIDDARLFEGPLKVSDYPDGSFIRDWARTMGFPVKISCDIFCIASHEVLSRMK